MPVMREHTPRASLVVCCTVDGKKSSLWVGEFGCWLLETSTNTTFVSFANRNRFPVHKNATEY